MKHLRRTRDDPGEWFTYRIERGRYVFTLNPDDLSVILSANPSTDLSEVATPLDPAPTLASSSTADTDLSEVARNDLSAHLSARNGRLGL